MRDPKLPQDEYNQRLHIYAETPGLQLVETVPAAEKELNATPDQGKQSPKLEDTNPYSKIPALKKGNTTDATDEDTAGPSTSQVTEKAKPRDPIYAELADFNSEDDRVERTGDKRSDVVTTESATTIEDDKSITTGTAAVATPHIVPKTTPSRPPPSQAVPNSSQSVVGLASSVVKAPAVVMAVRDEELQRQSSQRSTSSSSSAAKKAVNSPSKPETSKTIRTHTRLDASLEIPATPRPKLPGSANNNDEGAVLLLKKVERDPESGKRAKVEKRRPDDSDGISLKRVISLDSDSVNGEIVVDKDNRMPMPFDPDLDVNAAIIKKKQMFRRNLIIIISFLLVLLIVVAAVIISLVVVTRG